MRQVFDFPLPLLYKISKFMIDLKQDYSNYFSEISRIVKGEKVKITASVSQMRKIKESSDFYFIPFTDRRGQISENQWLLSLQKPKIAVIAKNKSQFDSILGNYAATNIDYSVFHFVLTVSDIIGNRFDIFIASDDADANLIEACQHSLKAN